MYNYSVVKYMNNFGYLGLYLGQIAFRYMGNGRLEHDSFSPKSCMDLVKLALYAGAIICLYNAPTWIYELNKSVTALWAEALFVRAIPQFAAGILITYHLPKVSSSCVSYPRVATEVDPIKKFVDAFDEENMKGVTIKGKLPQKSPYIIQISNVFLPCFRITNVWPRRLGILVSIQRDVTILDPHDQIKLTCRSRKLSWLVPASIATP